MQFLVANAIISPRRKEVLTGRRLLETSYKLTLDLVETHEKNKHMAEKGGGQFLPPHSF